MSPRPAPGSAHTALLERRGAFGPPLHAGRGFTWDRIFERFDGVDAMVDARFDRLRGDRRVDTAALLLSNLADYGAVWALIAAAKGRRRGPARRRAIRALAVAGVGSMVVNAGVKALVRRQRPAEGERVSTAARQLVRRPSSSSFPSGHTLAAFCTAVVLASSPAEAAAFLAFASSVAASRVHLEAHHATDVLGGALIGIALGGAGRRLALLLATPVAVTATGSPEVGWPTPLLPTGPARYR